MLRLLVISILGLLFFNSCQNQSVAGGEDFPNTLAGIDTVINSQLKQSSLFNPPQMGLAKSSPAALARSIASGGASSSTDTSVIIDSVHQIVYLIQQNLQSIDTIALKLDSKTFDTIKGNENILWIHSWTTGINPSATLMDDADGDGQVMPVSGVNDRIRVLQIQFMGNEVDSQVVYQGPGPDLNYDSTKDNPIDSFIQIKSINGIRSFVKKTSSLNHLQPWYPAVDSALLQIEQFDWNQSDTSSDHSIVQWLWNQDTTKSRPVNYQQVVHFVNGTLDSNWTTWNGDTLILSQQQVGLNSIPLSLKKINMIMLNNAWAACAIDVEFWNRIANEKSFEISAKSDVPVIGNANWESGTLNFQIIGTTESYRFVGQFNRNVISGTVSDSSGHHWLKTWNR